MNTLTMGAVAKLLQTWTKSSELLGGDEHVRDDLRALSKLLGRRALKDLSVSEFEKVLLTPPTQARAGARKKSRKASEEDIQEIANDLRSFYDSIPEGNVSQEDIDQRIRALKKLTVPLLRSLVVSLDLPVRKKTKTEMLEDIERWMTDRNQNVLKAKHGWF